jgi:hypothetical protein
MARNDERNVTMKRWILVGGAALLLLVLGAGTLVGSTLAQDDTTATPAAGTTGAPGDPYQAFVDGLAANLGLDPATVDAAVKKTLKDQVDARAAAAKERIDQGAFPRHPLRTWLRRHHERRAAGNGPNLGGTLASGRQFVSELAGFLGESPQDLRAEWAQGMTLPEIAAKHGKTTVDLKTFLTDQFEARLDQLLNPRQPATATPTA